MILTIYLYKLYKNKIFITVYSHYIKLLSTIKVTINYKISFTTNKYFIFFIIKFYFNLL